jgi:hypothetical protein
MYKVCTAQSMAVDVQNNPRKIPKLHDSSSSPELGGLGPLNDRRRLVSPPRCASVCIIAATGSQELHPLQQRAVEKQVRYRPELEHSRSRCAGKSTGRHVLKLTAAAELKAAVAVGLRSRLYEAAARDRLEAYACNRSTRTCEQNTLGWWARVPVPPSAICRSSQAGTRNSRQLPHKKG